MLRGKPLLCEVGILVDKFFQAFAHFLFLFLFAKDSVWLHGIGACEKEEEGRSSEMKDHDLASHPGGYEVLLPKAAISSTRSFCKKN
ncbi:hypothetical protein VNO77_33775 [Canavalia gladiata]|uniref:Uncharacterized protein n=1 Tax=Canavalia gladiata TaxID=3824 RepID=A0AAN9KFC3_CANGL